MLKDKVFIKSTAYPFSKIFGQTDRVCRFCKKIFCCSKCRDRHVDKVHPNVNADCSLCASEILPMRQCEFAKLNVDDEKLLCHIVDKHLPLRCRLCGVLFESREDFKSIAACKWFEHQHCLTSPPGHEQFEKKLKLYSTSDCNDSQFSTPPEIYRKTSTPIFVSQNANGFETPYVLEFSLKTNSPIAQIASISKTQTSETQFFSFLVHASNEELTPFRTPFSKDEQFPRSNSSRKLTIMEEEEKTEYKETERMIANAIEMSSPVNMDLTTPKGGVLQDSPKSDDVHEDAVKKVRFSGHKSAVGKVENLAENLTESCVRMILNTSEEDEFHDAHDETNVQKARTTTEDVKGANDTVNANDEKDTCIVSKDAENTNESRAEDKRRVVMQPSENFLNDSQIKIVLDSTKNVKEEKRDPEVGKEGTSTGGQRDSNTVLMMVLMESNSRGGTNDLIPLISSGLKKLQEQLVSARCQSPAAESANVCRRSITTMKMSVSSVETYSSNSAAAMTNREQPASSSSPSPVQSDDDNNNGGFLSTVAQVMKHALRSLSVSGLRIPPRSIEEAKVIQGRESVENVTPSQRSSSGAGNSQVRLGKRAREATERSSKENPIASALDTSPIAKRHRGWYKMIRGRQPIGRMRNSRVTTSPRGVSAEKQVFSQGSLTVGDTILPLPTRAHQSTE